MHLSVFSLEFVKDVGLVVGMFKHPILNCYVVCILISSDMYVCTMPCAECIIGYVETP